MYERYNELTNQICTLADKMSERIDDENNPVREDLDDIFNAFVQGEVPTDTDVVGSIEDLEKKAGK